MQVILNDFQILQGETVFDFPVGITIIQGKTGSGKTTLFYAVSHCLLNPSGVDDCINWFANQAKVTINNNNQSITWIKTPTSCEYQNNKTGQSYIKASKLDSRDLGDLGFYIDKNDNILNMHDEWSILFPFKSSDTEMFKIFEDMFNISSSFAIIDLIKDDEKNVKTSISNVDKEVNNCKSHLLQIEDIAAKIDEQQLTDFINMLTVCKERLDVLTVDYEKLITNYKYISFTIPDDYTISFLFDLNRSCNTIKQDYDSYLKSYKLKDFKIPQEYKFNVKKSEIFADFELYNSNRHKLDEYVQEDYM